MRIRGSRLAIAAVVSLVCVSGQGPVSRAVYQDPSQPIDQRVEDLLRRMTLEEKIGQMNMPCVYLPELGRDPASRREECRLFAAGKSKLSVGPGGGFFTLAHNALPEGPRQQAEYFNELQRIALQTRLKIPLLQSEEGTHGLMCSGGTVFPEGAAIASSWNMDLVRRIYAAAALEARAVGIHQLFTLVVEPNRDPRLGRNEEGYSEDPYLCSRIARAIVAGAQGGPVPGPEQVVAGLCHYPGQSEPVSGLERGAMHVSERMLREIFLPPWVAGIKEAGALGVMATYPAIDGVPAHASSKLLTKILREELGFRGLVLSEGGGLTTLVEERVAAGQAEAGALAVRAGVDVGISLDAAYREPLLEAVRQGKVPEELIDRAVRRILRQKVTLGLFEQPFVDVERAAAGLPRGEHRRLALEAARQGIVLLKNQNNLLPLAKSVRSIAVIGPAADHGHDQLGDYTSRDVLQPVVTVLDGIRRAVPRAKVRYVEGCGITGDKLNQIEQARKAARQSEFAIVVVGESEQTDGEGNDVASLDLTGMQEDLIRAVHATGTPTIVVLINGRPLSVRWAADHVPAIVEAWMPGEEGGTAVAEVLFGDYNPSGRLPLTIPRHVGQLPVYYNQPASKEYWTRDHAYVDMPATPLYPFGYGLSYTKFEYDGLKISSAEIGPDGEVTVTARVRNAGGRRGTEVAQLYVRDVVASVSRPVMELKGFERITLEPGESREVSFPLPARDLALLDQNLTPVVEPGRFEVMVGASSADIRLKGAFEVGAR